MSRSHYDQNVRYSVLVPSNLVLVHVKSFQREAQGLRPDGKIFPMKLLDVLKVTFLYLR